MHVIFGEYIFAPYIKICQLGGVVPSDRIYIGVGKAKEACKSIWPG